MPETQFSKVLKAVGILLNQLKEYVSEDTEGTKEEDLRNKKTEIKNTLNSMEDSLDKQRAMSFIAEYKKLKNSADASNATNMAQLKKLLENSHNAAEKELQKTKTYLEMIMKAAARTVDGTLRTNIESLTSWIPGATAGLTTLNEAYLLAINEIEKKLKGFTKKTDRTIIISQLTAKLKNITEELQKEFAKYALSKTNQIKSYTKNLKEFPCFIAFIKILMGIAGISSENKDSASGKTEGKEYVKIFGRGYLVKATYTAITNIYDSYGEPKAEKSAVAERPMVEV